jgi:hypothetical protein
MKANQDMEVYEIVLANSRMKNSWTDVCDVYSESLTSFVTIDVSYLFSWDEGKPTGWKEIPRESDQERNRLWRCSTGRVRQWCQLVSTKETRSYKSWQRGSLKTLDFLVIIIEKILLRYIEK